MKLFRKKIHGADNDTGEVSAAPLAKPTAVDILRYRYHNGTNLGSIYVLEKWLFPSMFMNSAGGGSELDAVRASISANGLEATRAKWEQHWRKAVSAEDWKWLKEKAPCTTIRLPIGYYTLGPQFCKGTPFNGDISSVYINAWSSVKQLVKTAASNGIGVILDMHALPGGANTDSHSGTSSKQASLWTSSTARQQATDSILFLAREAASDASFAAGLAGIQIVNEAKHKALGMFEWYDSVLDGIATVGVDVPVYVSDAWDLGPAVKWARRRSEARGAVVVDTHKYFCFGGKSEGLGPREIIGKSVPELFGGVDLRGVDVVVGEWSCVLGEKAWAKVGKEERGPLTKQFGLAESRKWYEKTGGNFFWTWKMDWMPGGGWGYRQQIKGGNLFIPPGLLLSPEERSARLASVETKKEARYKDAGIRFREKHEGILKGKVNVLGYTQGWKDGWEDSAVFFGGSGDIIGLLG
ncbi:Glucan 1,3-beta-glucosidase, partial [Lachnellula suecica]